MSQVPPVKILCRRRAICFSLYGVISVLLFPLVVKHTGQYGTLKIHCNNIDNPKIHTEYDIMSLSENDILKQQFFFWFFLIVNLLGFIHVIKESMICKILYLTLYVGEILFISWWIVSLHRDAIKSDVISVEYLIYGLLIQLCISFFTYGLIALSLNEHHCFIHSREIHITNLHLV